MLLTMNAPLDIPSPFAGVLAEYDSRREKALAMGGAAKLAKRAAPGILNARQRVDYLCDTGTFIESGLFRDVDQSS